jgi:hypothetical protein
MGSIFSKSKKLQQLKEIIGVKSPQCMKNRPLLSQRNPNLGLTTKARAYKVTGQERKPGSKGKCEGMNPRTPKGASTLGVWSPGGLPNLQREIAGVKTQWIEEPLISLKIY